MAYKDIPLAGDKLSTSQSDIRQNFLEINTVVSQDHETFGNPNQGKHKQAIFTKQAASTSTAGDEVAVYCKDNAGGDPSLFVRKESDADEIDITSYTNSVPAGEGKGYTFLPSGILLCWGSVTMGVGSSGTSDTYALAYKAATTPFQVITSVSGLAAGKTDAQNVAVLTTFGNNTSVSFSRSRSENVMTLRYLAIGIKY